MDLRLLKWNGLYLLLGTIHLLPGMGGRGGVRVSEDFWGGHMVFQENRGVSRSLTGVREGTMEN